MDDRSWEEFSLKLERRFEFPLRGLRDMNELRATLDRIERELVLAARSNRSSWEEIGGALGISRQAARARHRPFVKRADGVRPRPFG